MDDLFTKIVKVYCEECDTFLGRFSPMGDNSGVIIECPHCWHGMRVNNRALCHPDEHGRSYCEIKIIEVEKVQKKLSGKVTESKKRKK